MAGTVSSLLNWLRSPGPALFLFFLSLYSLTYPGLFTTSLDGAMMLETARKIIDGHGVLVKVPQLGGVVAYSKLGIGISLAYLPFDVLAVLIRPGNPIVREFLDGLTHVVIGAFTAWGVYFALLSANLSKRQAVTGAFLAGLTTPIWVYANQDFAESLQACLIPWMAGMCLQARQHPGWKWPFLLGLTAGALFLTKAAAALAALVLAAAFLLDRQRLPRVALPGFLGALPALAFFAWFNWARFGSPLETGYGEEASQFTQPLLEGLFGLTLWPGKGILFFAPLLFLAPCLKPGWRHLPAPGRRAMLACTALTAAFLLFFAKWHSWQGGFCFGPRFIVPVLPLTAGMLAGALSATPVWDKKVFKAALVILTSLGVLQNFAGTATRLRTTYDHGFVEECVHSLFTGVPINKKNLVVRCWPPAQVTQAQYGVERLPRFIARAASTARGETVPPEPKSTLHYWWSYAMAKSPKGFWLGLIGLFANLAWVGLAGWNLRLSAGRNTAVGA